MEDGIPGFKMFTIYPGVMISDPDIFKIMEAAKQEGALWGFYAESNAIAEFVTEKLWEYFNKATPRSGMPDLMKEDYVRTARPKGLSNAENNIKHVFRNSLISVVSSFGFIFAALISGSVITENVFALPGLGKLLTDSILLRDYSTVQGVALLLALVFVGINLLVDISYAKIDPRVRYSD